MGFAFSGPSYTVAQRGSQGQEYYSSAVAVWQQRLGIENALNKLKSDIRGDEGTAKQIENFLNTVNKYITSGGNVTTDELEVLNGYIPKDLQPSYSMKSGTDFEKWLDKLFQQVLNTDTSFNTGGNLATSGVREKIGELDLTIDVATGSISLKRTKGELGQGIRELVTKDIKQEFRNKANSLGYAVEGGAEDQSSAVFLYQSWKQQKSDLDTEFHIEGEFLHEKAAALLANHTYSVKNYANLSRGVELGKSKGNRDLFSIYYYFAGDGSLANAERFVYSSYNSHDPGTINLYQTWASALYELTGLGTVSGGDLKNLRLVDFLIVQSRGAGYVSVYSTKQFLQGFPSTPPGWFNTSTGSISSGFFNNSSFVMG